MGGAAELLLEEEGEDGWADIVLAGVVGLAVVLPLPVVLPVVVVDVDVDLVDSQPTIVKNMLMNTV